MDGRWLVRPEVELGLSRLGIFGGEGRPSPGFGQLLLPTEPHIYDDPERLKPDTDEKASVDFRFASAVAAFGMLLRYSEHKGTASYAQVLELAEVGEGRDQASRKEFRRLVEKAATFAGR